MRYSTVVRQQIPAIVILALVVGLVVLRDYWQASLVLLVMALVFTFVSRRTFRPYPLMILVAVMIVSSTAGLGYTSAVLLPVVATPFVLLACGWWPSGWHFRHRAFSNAVMVPLMLVIAVSVGYTHWPLKLAYRVSKPAMESLAVKVENGEDIRLPRNAGVFRISKAEVGRSGVVCLWTWPPPAGNTGFVRTSPEGAERFNLWSVIHLDSDWQLIEED